MSVLCIDLKKQSTNFGCLHILIRNTDQRSITLKLIQCLPFFFCEPTNFKEFEECIFKKADF
jgi:hypothetical protein